MGEVTYSVWLGDQLLADRMSIDSAVIFVKALFENHFEHNNFLRQALQKHQTDGFQAYIL